MKLIKYLKFMGLSLIGLMTGYFVFLLMLKVSGRYDPWVSYVRGKYGVGIWDV